MDYQIGNFIEPVIMALPPLVLPAIAAGMGLIDPISKFFTARKQKKMARNLKKSTYVPESLNTAISEGRQGAYSARGLDQGVDEALLRKQQAGQQYMGKQAGGSSAQKLAMAAQVGGNFSDRLRQITAQGRRGQHGRRQNYQNLLLGKANVQMENQRVFEGAKSALIGASMQNRHNAWSGVGGAVGNVLGTIAKYKMPEAPLAEGTMVEATAPDPTITPGVVSGLPDSSSMSKRDGLVANNKWLMEMEKNKKKYKGNTGSSPWYKEY